MAKGKRYEEKPKLNKKKVFLCLFIIAIIVLGIVLINKEPSPKKNVNTKNISNSYILVYENSKWGVINSKGNYVINPSYPEMITIPNNTREVFIIQTNVDIDNGTFDSYAINDKNEKIFTNYDKVEALQNIDKAGQSFIADNTLKVSKDGKFGLINLSGNELATPQYDEITPIKYLQNSYLTKKDGKYGLIDNSGSVIINNEYDSIEAFTDKYEDGYLVKKDGKYGLIKYSKKQVLDTKYDKILNITSNDSYIVDDSGTYKLLNKDLEPVLVSNNLQYAVDFGSDYVVLNKNGNYSIIFVDDGSELTSGYQYIEHVSENNFIAKKNGTYGIIDKAGNTVLDFKYTNIINFSSKGFLEGENEDGTVDLLDTSFVTKVTGIVSEINSKNSYIKVRIGDQYKYYNYKLEERSSKDIFTTNTIFLSKKNGKYGFVDKNGIVIVDYLYDDATEQNDYGYAAVKKNGLWGAIDGQGTVIVEPSLKLEQNTIISFIGKWHLAPDTNVNYYTNYNE